MRTGAVEAEPKACGRAQESGRPATVGARVARGPARLRQEAWQSIQTLSAAFWKGFPEIEKRKLKVEILYVLDCPFHTAAVKLVREVLATEEVAAEINEVLVADREMAHEIGFLGSPTVRINGRDVMGESQNDKNVGLACRLYEGSTQIGLPPSDSVRQAVRQA